MRLMLVCLCLLQDVHLSGLWLTLMMLGLPGLFRLLVSKLRYEFMMLGQSGFLCRSMLS